MTQEELRKEIFELYAQWHGACSQEVVDDFMNIINSHVADVIGENEEEWPEVNTVLIGDGAAMERNELRAVQRERAGI